MQIIELEQYPDYEFRTDLGETEYLIRLHYLERFDSWLIDLLDSNEDPIIEGLPVVLGKPLLSQIVDVRKPAGDLIFLQLGNDNVPPNYDGFGTKYLLFFMTDEEIAAAQSG